MTYTQDALERFVTLGGWEGGDAFGGTSNAFPSYWVRKDPKNDAADYIVVLGVSVALPPGNPEAAEGALNVTTCTFGAIPDGWDSATVQFSPDELEDYRRMTDSEREALAKKQAATSRRANDRRAKYPDGSPWSRS
jgi:hypothetical protein